MSKWTKLTGFSVWITLSSSVILFNKHILDYAQFRKLNHLRKTVLSKVANKSFSFRFPYVLALYIPCIIIS